MVHMFIDLPGPFETEDNFPYLIYSLNLTTSELFNIGVKSLVI